MRVSASAPTRIDLAGGTLDIWPVCRLLDEPAVTVNAAISLRAHAEVETTTDGHLRMDGGGEAVDLPPGELRHDRMGLVTRLVERFGVGDGLTISLKAEVPPGSGLAGSSAMAVAVGGALARLHDWEPSEDELLAWVQDAELRLLGKPAGYQDYVPALRGAVHTLVAAPTRVERRRDDALCDFLTGRLLLVDTAIAHHSGMNNWQVVRAFLDGDPAVVKRLNRINVCARRAHEALAARDLDALAAAVNDEWQERRELSPVVSNETIERLLGAALAAGARAGKVCGAGGGGALVLLVEDAERVRAAVAEAGGIPLDFHLDRDGLRVEP